jgi:hypothetical protein
MANEISNSGQFQTTGYQNTAIPQSAHDSSSVVSNTLIPGSQGSGYEALPRIIKVDSSTGCTLTKAHIKGLTPGEFEALGNKETDLARVIASSAEAKLLGVEERGLTALLTSSVQNIKPLINKQNIAEQSIILPYIQRRQRSVLNANYFAVESGEASSADTAVHPYASGYSNQQGDYEVALNMGGSDWSSPIESLERYFLPGGTVIVNHWASDGSSKEVQFTIVGSRNANAGGIEKAKVMLRPTGGGINPVGHSDGVVPAGIASDYQPTAGILQTIANNVNDYEAWCKNQPTDLSVRLLVNWLQTTRESREVNDTYKKTLESIMSGKVNPYLSSMVYQPLAEQNKLAAKVSQDQWNRAVWYNQALSSVQKPETYMQLPGVSDPEDSNCTLEYKANALGIKSLLNEGGRVKDNGGNALDLDNLFSDLYFLKRNREQDGDTISVIDAMTDRLTSNRIFDAMNRYYTLRYGWEVQRNAQLNQKIEHNGIILFNYNIYDIPEVGVQLAIFHDPMFDDLLNVGTGNKYLLDGSRSSEAVFAGTEADGSTDLGKFSRTHRMLWLVDWSDVKIGIAGTNSVTRSQPHPEVDRLYSCRMDSVKRTFNLRSTKWTTMMDRPHRHLILENISDKVEFTLGGTTHSF